MRTFRPERVGLATLWAPAEWIDAPVQRGAIRFRPGWLTASYELDAPGPGGWHHLRIPVDTGRIDDPRATAYRSPADPELVVPPAAHRPGGLLLGPLLQHRLGSRFVWRSTLERTPGYRRAIAARLTRRLPPPSVRMGAGDGRARVPGTFPVSAGARGHWTLTDWAAGTPLHELLVATDRHARARIPARLEVIGEALAEFHASARHESSSTSHRPAEARRSTGERGTAGELATLAALRESAGSIFIADALAAHDSAVARLAADAGRPSATGLRASGLLHGDLHDRQILLDGDTMHLIDLDGAAPGPVALDLGNLEAHLILRSLQTGFGVAAARPQIEALAAGYARSGTAPPARERAWFRRAALLRLSLLYLFRLSPIEVPTALLEAAVRDDAAKVTV